MQPRSFAIIAFLVLTFSSETFSQCMMAPLSLNQRVVNASTIVLGKLKQSDFYISANNKIYTSNIVEVKAYLKGHSSHKEIIVISEGGQVGDRAEDVYPALELDIHHEVILMLQDDNTKIDNKSFRITYPNAPQMEAYACSQGKPTYQDGLFYDLLSESPAAENVIFAKINRITKSVFLTPDGKIYQPRYYTPPSIHSSQTAKKSGIAKVTSISGVSPNPGISGTINASDQITISGSGFGASIGTVEFRNANDGGATYIQSSVPTTDIISWSDGSIVMKLPQAAGTNLTDGIRVNGTFTFGYTVTYAHIEINNISAGFASSTRQRFYLVNKNGNGGYSFVYSTGFAANTAAVAAFERAMESWRCNTFVNFSVDKSTTTSITTSGSNGVNVVSFDVTLPAGVLGRANSLYTGVSSGGCTLQNTTRYTSEIDIQFQDPPYTGYTWNYGPAASVAFGTTYDFESVALHELGHAHGLGHIIASGKVMNYALFNGSDARVLDATSDIAGGVAKLAYSSNASNYCIKYPSGVTGPMTLLNSGTCALPVSLLYFTGKNLNHQQNLLEWATTEETLNKEFELYQSKNGTDFEILATVAGAGHLGHKYSYTHDLDQRQYLTYYKLLQIDQDGHRTSFPIVTIATFESMNATLFFEPGDKIIYSSFSKPLESDSEWILYNNTGQIISRNKITKGTLSASLNAFGFNSGVYYYYQISGNGINSKGKIAVMQVW